MISTMDIYIQHEIDSSNYWFQHGAGDNVYILITHLKNVINNIIAHTILFNVLV